jgi:hypothetical protein
MIIACDIILVNYLYVHPQASGFFEEPSVHICLPTETQNASFQAKYIYNIGSSAKKVLGVAKEINSKVCACTSNS